MCSINQTVSLPYFRGATWFGAEGKDHVGKLHVPCAAHYAGDRSLATLQKFTYKEKKRGHPSYLGWKIYTGWGQFLGILSSKEEAEQFCNVMRQWKFSGLVVAESATLPKGRYELADVSVSLDDDAWMMCDGKGWKVRRGAWSFTWSRPI